MQHNEPQTLNKKSLSLSAGLVIVTVIILVTIFSTEPKAEKEGATKRTPMLVDTMRVQQGQHAPVIKALGTVVPAQQIELKARVTGEITALSEEFVPGAFLKKGTWLIQVDDADYALAYQRAEAMLANAQAKYEIEMAEQVRARKALETVRKSIAPENKALVLREPQKRQAEAELKMAEATLQQTRLDLERTRISMPFDGQIISRDANLGSRISTNDMLANVVGTEKYWIEASLPQSRLQWLEIPANDLVRPEVIVRNSSAWQAEQTMTGRLIQLISVLDENSRMARALVEVKDPMGLTSTSNERIQLIAGSYVEVELKGRSIDNSTKLPVRYLRKRNTVWVAKDNKLDIRTVTVAFQDDQFAYITAGLEDNEQIIITDISAVRQGVDVRIRDTETSGQ
ncbi:MAG: efflux RND transporter periplasmic adaptor subunit [Gammaproteobacteria bacterium]|nr:efflux RND transporter periplasmic adaptor subunit [Gammaproteobacteria bacterium]